MSYQLIKKRELDHWVKLSGRLTVRDFQGWSNESGWENTSFLDDDAEGHSKLAFVGDEKWKDEIFLFTGKPMRQTAIEFFPQDQLDQAQAWLAGKNSFPPLKKGD